MSIHFLTLLGSDMFSPCSHAYCISSHPKACEEGMFIIVTGNYRTANEINFLFAFRWELICDLRLTVPMHVYTEHKYVCSANMKTSGCAVSKLKVNFNLHLPFLEK